MHRRDHRTVGEGSSGICWLDDKGIWRDSEGLLERVLSRLERGAFIVTDGSNAIKSLATYWWKKDFPADAHLTLKPVTLHGVRLRCVGSLSPGYGPTSIWQVVRMRASSTLRPRGPRDAQRNEQPSAGENNDAI